MAEQIVNIDISANAEVTVEGVGIVGPDCVKLTEALEKSLGVQGEQTLKPEYRQVADLRRSVKR